MGITGIKWIVNKPNFAVVWWSGTHLRARGIILHKEYRVLLDLGHLCIYWN